MFFLCPGCGLVVYFVYRLLVPGCGFILLACLCWFCPYVGVFILFIRCFFFVGCCPFLCVLGEVLSVFRFFCWPFFWLRVYSCLVGLALLVINSYLSKKKNSDLRGFETLETPNIFLYPSILSLVTILIWSCFIIERFVLQVHVVISLFNLEFVFLVK